MKQKYSWFDGLFGVLFVLLLIGFLVTIFYNVISTRISPKYPDEPWVELYDKSDFNPNDNEKNTLKLIVVEGKAVHFQDRTDGRVNVYLSTGFVGSSTYHSFYYRCIMEKGAIRINEPVLLFFSTDQLSESSTVVSYMDYNMLGDIPLNSEKKTVTIKYWNVNIQRVVTKGNRENYILAPLANDTYTKIESQFA